MATLSRWQEVDRFVVQSLIKENLYTETYRVEDEDGQPFFMKVFVMKRMPEKLLDSSNSNVLEIVYSQQLKHRNIVSYVSSGSIETQEGTCQYYVTDYFSGELLVERIQREGRLPQEEAVRIYRGVLEGLKYMHSLQLYHNDITPRNIMLTATAGEPEIIDLGHVSKACSGAVTFDTSDLEVLYGANETFAGVYDEQSDIFAATAVLYAMLTGEAPWQMTFAENMKRSRRAIMLKDKRKEEELNLEVVPVDERIKGVLTKGLAPSYGDRYKSVEEVLHALESDQPEASKAADDEKADTSHRNNYSDTRQKEDDEFEVKRGGGNGFKDIAGMRELKDYLQQRVIFVIKNKEKAEKYKLNTPNGMLLYGPPGCGKSFVAEKFAEETGFNFILIKSSDLASTFIHGSQEKIGRLFKKAEHEAPVVICFDEFDALVPDRSNPGAQYSAGEVNEFLTQLNNCSKRGIFVIGTTNRPDKIDPAVLRTGRIDKQVYVPLPDKEARGEMFLIHLQGRPFQEQMIDAEKLAEMSDGFIASDIAYVVNDAAMIAAFTDQDITQELLETAIKNTHPSLRPDTLRIYDDIRRKMDSTERRNMERPRVGFPITSTKE